MSFDTHKTWTFGLYGKNVKLWQVASGSTIVELSGYKLRLPQDYVGKQLVYPTETITDGLLFTGTAFVEPFVDVDPNELDGNDNPTLTEDTTPSVSEGIHVNCTRMVALAIVDYIKSQVAESAGNVELKEYYMKEFWGKVSDNKSNRSIAGIIVPKPTYAVI